MKRFLFIFLLAFVCCFAVGCGGNGGDKDSDPEGSMKTNGLQVLGTIEGAVVLNPTFVWANDYEDSSFVVKIFKDDELIIEEETNKTHYAVDDYLVGDTAYRVEVKGVVSGISDELTFMTIGIPKDLRYIKLDNPFGSNMVLQRGKEIAFSGSGPALSLVTVAFGDKNYYGTTDEDGLFEIKVPAQSASFDPIDIVVGNGIDNSVTISNVLIGDVYLFAGQSNMQWPTISSDYLDVDVENARSSNVRFFCQDVEHSSTKLNKVKNGRWFAINENNYLQFSAIAFMSGSMLSDAMSAEVPIGIVTAYQGDTNIANWMGPEYYTGTASTKYLHYNAMIYPLRHTKLSGVVWYQGCNNSGAGGDYKGHLLDLFTNYRDLFESPDMPFFVIGLCCYNGDSGNNYDFSYVREAQAMACEEDDSAYFISTCDDGDPGYIHPRVKRYICERVSKSIQSAVYGKDYMSGGPTYLSHTVEDGKIIVQFKNAEGLHAVDEIANLFVAGSDGKYFLAEGEIVGETLVAHSASVSDPVYVKYGFGKSPFVNIFNKDGFAITPFRTDNYNLNIDLLEYNNKFAYSSHPDGSNMSVNYVGDNLSITKAADGRTYGSVRLNKWGMIAYNPQGFRFGFVGTNSGAKISFRAVEGSYEIWAYKVVDDFIGEREFTCGVSEFEAVYNKVDGIFDTQKIQYIEIMIEAPGAVTLEVTEARFIEMGRSAPMDFSISSCAEEGENVRISAYKSVFADNYTIEISESGIGEGTPLYTATSADSIFSVPKSLFETDVPYYVFITATNELGEKAATNNGFVFYLKDEFKRVVCNFDFATQESLEAYMAISMSVNAGLTVTLTEDGVRIDSAGAGWQQFIFKLESGLGSGMSKLKFTADFSNYNGRVVLQLADTNWNNYSYTLDIESNPSGTYEIDFSSFLIGGTTPFTTQTLMWVMFNFDDSTGGGYILLDDVQLLK